MSLNRLVPPMTGEVTIEMAAPPEEVWALVSDVTRIGEFSPETFEARWTRGRRTGRPARSRPARSRGSSSSASAPTT